MVCYHESLVACNINKVYSYQGYRHYIVSWYVCANCYKCISLYEYMNQLSQTNTTTNKIRQKQKITKYFNTFNVTLENDKSKEKIE